MCGLEGHLVFEQIHISLPEDNFTYVPRNGLSLPRIHLISKLEVYHNFHDINALEQSSVQLY